MTFLDRRWMAFGTVLFILGFVAFGVYTKAQFDNPGPFLTETGVASYDGRFSIEVPEVYELLHIAIAVSELSGSEDDRWLIDKRTAYHQEVIAHFESYQDHELINLMERSLATARAEGNSFAFTNIREQALFYDLDEQGNLVKTSDYYVSPFVMQIAQHIPVVPFSVDKHMQLISDFSRETEFQAFYEEHTDYYESLTETAEVICDYTNMWRWLEANFPQRYQSYRVIMSPLTGGLHSTNNYATVDGSSKQSLMWISAPVSETPYDQLPVEERADECRVVFTEIDHNYVNPTTDNYLEDLQMAMPDYTHWNDETQGYLSAYATFNEYMTWGVFSLYVMDTYPEHEWEQIIRKQEAFMQTNRGFPEFRTFNRELMRLYQEKDADETVAELYPEILTWVAKQNGS